MFGEHSPMICSNLMNARRPQSRAPIQNKDEASNKRKDDEGGKDNWELPEVDLPYC